MNKFLVRCAQLSLVLLPTAVVAQPVELKLAFFGSDQSATYLAGLKPFIDAVNSEDKNLLKVVLYSGGVLGREVAQQTQAVRDDKADIAFVVPGYSPAAFPDNSVVEMPGMFRNTREATLVYTRLIALKALRGYDEFSVLGAFVSEQETIHSRLPIASLDDLKGKTIRVNNAMEANALGKLGALPVSMPIMQVANAISSGAIDGAAVSSTPLSDFGIKRVALNHYLLAISGAPLALLMNRKRFEALPERAQGIIRKYSGEWLAARFIDAYDRSDSRVMEELKSDPKRRVVLPSSPDLETVHIAFKSVVADWEAKSSGNRDLLRLAETELTKLRASR
jgi:TRAP-type C4-dicarboxylate transport system substrate-binding protein